jgi:FSR family fosmidomycin resistance protein-like MFS transporter
LGLAAGHALHDTYTSFLAPLLPLFIDHLSLSKAQAGLLTVFTQGPSLIQPVIGHQADRFNLHFIIYIAPAFTAALMSLLGIIPSYLILALLLTLVGFSSAAFHAVGPVVAGRLSGKNLGLGMSFWMVGGELGRVLGPIVIVTTIRFLSLDNVPWLMCGGFLLSIILYFEVRRVPFKTHSDHIRVHWREALQKMRPVMLPLSGLVLMRSFVMASLTIYLPTYLTELGSDLWLAGISLSVMQGAGVIGALIGGSLSDRVGRHRILLISCITVALFMMIFLISSGWIHFPLLLILGFSLLSMTPVIMALVQESFPESRAFANGVYMCMSFCLRSLVVVLIGALGDWFGLSFSFIISAVMMLLAIPFILLLPRGKGGTLHAQRIPGET